MSKPVRKRAKTAKTTDAKTRKQYVSLANAIVPLAKAALAWAELPLRLRRDYLAGFSGRSMSRGARRVFRKFLGDMYEAMN